jgi:hypothetical protein
VGLRRDAPRVALATALVAAAASLSPASAGAVVRAGVGDLDASWHVGASAGQYASDGSFGGDHGLDPNLHAIRRKSSYGRQSELRVRALVIEGDDGGRIAIVKNDNYLPQDLLHRRTAQLLERGGSGITRETLSMVSTHNHSSPYYSTPSWGVWTFQDVFDVRFYDYLARRQADAIELAAGSLRPVRIGASVTRFDKTARHSLGPAVADDGGPAGYPHSDTDHDLTVIRFDDVSDPDRPRPLANLVNYAMHPESLDGNDLISADYVGPLQRMLDRSTGAMTLFSQGSVGTAEPERSSYHSIHERLELTHRQYGQAEYAASLMSGAALGAWRDIARGTPDDAGRFVPFSTEMPVEMRDRWYPGPFSHPLPSVSSCRTDRALALEPQLPLVGLPDCTGPRLPPELRQALGGNDPGLDTDDFERLGIPVPENYGAPSYTGLEETLGIHLQAIRLGDILLTLCSCEQWKDQGMNIKTRTDRVAGNEYLGFDWTDRCVANGDRERSWTCPDPRDGGTTLYVSDRVLRRMRAQVRNPANGWNDLANVAWAESEPVDPRAIKGNFTHDDDAASAARGYLLTVPIGMANDYNGYIATYREFQRGDHYRKALTGWGPHSADYLATRLVTLGRQLRDPSWREPRDQLQERILDWKLRLDELQQDAKAAALGTVGSAAITAFETLLPDDGGPVGPVSQPDDVERFGAALFEWVGGSNFTDNPVVRVERRVRGGWAQFADGSGEVPVTLRFPQADDVPGYLTGDHQWRWTAHFETFAAPFDLRGRPRATPAGTYRFVVDGVHRAGHRAAAYRVVSREFRVSPWTGIAVEDARLDARGRASFRLGPRRALEVTGGGPKLRSVIGPIDYPDSYRSPARFIDRERTAFRDPDAPGDASRLEWFCFSCSWRPWADAGDARRVRITIGRGARRRTVTAVRRGGRWVTPMPLAAGERAWVRRGGVRDAFGNLNGAPSAVVAR